MSRRPSCNLEVVSSTTEHDPPIGPSTMIRQHVQVAAVSATSYAFYRSNMCVTASDVHVYFYHITSTSSVPKHLKFLIYPNSNFSRFNQVCRKIYQYLQHQISSITFIIKYIVGLHIVDDVGISNFFYILGQT